MLLPTNKGKPKAVRGRRQVPSLYRRQMARHWHAKLVLAVVAVAGSVGLLSLRDARPGKERDAVRCAAAPGSCLSRPRSFAWLCAAARVVASLCAARARAQPRTGRPVCTAHARLFVAGELLSEQNELWDIAATQRASRHSMLDIPTHAARSSAARLRARRARTSALASVPAAQGLWAAGQKYSNREKRVLQALSNIQSHLERGTLPPRGSRGRQGGSQWTDLVTTGADAGGAALKRALDAQPSTQLAAQALAGGDTGAEGENGEGSDDSLPVPMLSIKDEMVHRKMDVGFQKNIQEMMAWNSKHMKALVKRLDETKEHIKEQEAELADLRTMAKSSKEKMDAVRVSSKTDLLNKIIDKEGEEGPVGIKGMTGELGKPGKDGKNGSPGPRGMTGPRGPRGPPGQDGRMGAE